MPKLRREEVADLDVKVLDEQEYTEGDFESYEGEIPPANTELTGYVQNMWWCRTQEKDDGTGLDPMIKVLWVAGDNEGELEEFNGLPIWENLVLVPGAKFRWAPFLNVHGITLKEIKASTYVGEDDDERIGGAPIEKIGNFVPGQDSDDAWSRVITKRRFWNDEWRAEAKSWLPWADGDAPEESTEPEEPEEPEDLAEGEGEEEPELFEDEDGNTVDAEGNIYEENEDGEFVMVEEEPEPEPEPAKPARGRRAAAKPAAAKPAARTAAKPAATRPAGRAAAAKPAATASSSRGRKPAAAKAAKPATGRGRGKAAKDNEPPF